MGMRAENSPGRRHPTQFGLQSGIVCFASIGVLLALLEIDQLEATAGLIVLGVTLSLMLLAVPVVLRQMIGFPLERFRTEWSIVCFVSLGGAFYGASCGGIVGVEASEGGRLIDRVFFASVYAFALGAFGVMLFACGSVCCLGILSVIFWVIRFLARMVLLVRRVPSCTQSEGRRPRSCGSEPILDFIRYAPGLGGLIVGTVVGATVFIFVSLEIPTEQDAVVIRVLLPAVVGASFGSLAGKEQ